jgi:hypothetical protein
MVGMESNAEIEMRWVDAWNNLSDIVGERHGVLCLLPDGSVVDVEACRGWLQDSVYGGFAVQLKSGWVGHKLGVIASRSDLGAPNKSFD